MTQPTQYQIEQEAGITPEIAKHMMKKETSAARSAMDLLAMCCRFCEPCSLTLLKEAVKDCAKEIRAAGNTSEKST